MSKKEFSSSHTIQNHCSTSISILMKHPVICIINYWSPRNKDGKVHTYTFKMPDEQPSDWYLVYSKKWGQNNNIHEEDQGDFPKRVFLFSLPYSKNRCTCLTLFTVCCSNINETYRGVVQTPKTSSNMSGKTKIF